MRVNLLGVMAGTRDAARHMAEHGGGSIINLGSIGGIQAGGGVSTYRASKAAIIHFTKCAAIELAHYEVRVNCIAPGNIPTPILASSATEEDSGTPRAVRGQDPPADARRPSAEARGHRRRRRRSGAVPRHGPVAVRHRIVLPVDGGTVAGKVIVRKPAAEVPPA